MHIIISMSTEARSWKFGEKDRCLEEILRSLVKLIWSY